MSGMHEVPNTGYKKPGKNGWTFDIKYFPEEDSVYIGVVKYNLLNKTCQELFEDHQIGVKTDKEGKLVGIIIGNALKRWEQIWESIGRVRFNQDLDNFNFGGLLKSFSEEAYKLYLSSRNPKS